jgi:SNF2 family DNA or RNA helicase
MSRLEKKRGNKALLKKGHPQTQSAIYVDYREGRKIRLSIGSEQEPAFQKLAAKYFDENLTIRESSFAVFEKILEEARRISDDFRCYDDALELVLHRREHLGRQERVNELFPQGIASPMFDNLLKVNLFDYQKEGVLFAARAGRCLIADEMGLGKTIQAIAAAELFRREFGVGRVLIVCPTSLKYQWKSEIERFTDSDVFVVEGTVVARRKHYEKISAQYTIAGYHTVANDLKQLNDLDFDLIILDEAQRIKNWATKTSAAIKKLRATYAVVLTGTPLENKLEELYSIMQVIDQFRLPPLYSFLNRYTIKEENGKVVGFRHLKEIGETLGDLLLRRTKKQVLKQLPKRMDKTLLVAMTQEQMALHNGLSEEVGKLIAKWQRQRFLHENDRKRLMLFLSQMRMACDSTFILDQKTRHDTKVMELMCILEEFFTNGDGEKVVVFSQWERMARLVAQELEERNIGFQFLHGGVPSQKRGDLLTNFKEDPDCLVFLSTDAGGVGLNLQNASLVINMDIPWNPAVLEQRIGRVYRMGQERVVQVINLVSKHTIEERLLNVLKFKDSMAKGVLDDGEDVIFMENTRFNELMGKIEDLTAGAAPSAPGYDHDAYAENIEEEVADIAALPEEAPGEMRSPAKPVLHEKESDPAPKEPTPKPSPIPGDDDVPVSAPQGAGSSGRRGSAAPATPEELVQTGVSFLSGLVKTLSDPGETQKLVNSITAKDETTGQTYLKIPVENEATVANALTMLGGLLKAFGGR